MFQEKKNIKRKIIIRINGCLFQFLLLESHRRHEMSGWNRKGEAGCHQELRGTPEGRVSKASSEVKAHPSESKVKSQRNSYHWITKCRIGSGKKRMNRRLVRLPTMGLMDVKVENWGDRRGQVGSRKNNSEGCDLQGKQDGPPQMPKGADWHGLQRPWKENKMIKCICTAMLHRWWRQIF